MTELEARRAEALDETKRRDFSIPCIVCHAETGDPCTGLSPGAWVHFARRLKVLCLERRPDLLEPVS